MLLLQGEFFFFLFCVIDFIQTEVGPNGENVCLHTETFEENTMITVLKPKKRKETRWCFSLSNFFRCEETVTTWVREKVPKVFTRKKIVPRCCVGYKEKNEGITKCVPECLKVCVHGKCVAPEICACEPGFYGPTCRQGCPREFWGKNCLNKCDCSMNGACDPVSGKCYCSPGWNGERCELPCKSGYYGLLCQHECNCDGQICNHQTGACIPSEKVANFTAATSTENSFGETFTNANQSASFGIYSTKIQLFESENEGSTKEVSTVATTDAFIFKSTQFKEEINFLKNSNSNKNILDETASTEPMSDITGSLININTRATIPTNESKNESSSNSSDIFTDYSDYDGFEVTISEEKKTVNASNKGNTISFNATEENKYKNETENFISKRHKDANEETTPIYLRFLPTFSVLAGVSFITFITAAGWVIVKHLKKAKIMVLPATYKDRTQSVFQLEEKLKHQPDEVLWVSNYTRSSAYLSDEDFRSPTPILKTFKPGPEDKKFIPIESRNNEKNNH